MSSTRARRRPRPRVRRLSTAGSSIESTEAQNVPAEEDSANEPEFNSTPEEMLPSDLSEEEVEVDVSPVTDEESTELLNDIFHSDAKDLPDEKVEDTDEVIPSEQSSPEPENPHLEMFRSIPPKYTGHVKLLRWGHTSSSGMWVTLELLDVNEMDSHPFKGLRAAKGSKTEGQRMRIVVMHSEDLSDTPGEPVYSGESLLTWWAEDCNEGKKTTIKLDDGIDGVGNQHPFDGMQHGRTKGEILSLVAWAIDDQDQPDTPKARRNKSSFAQLTATSQSHILCRDTRFFEWLRTQEYVFIKDDAIRYDLAILADDGDQNAYCENVVKVWCQISSRAEFSQDDEHGSNARNRWKVMLDHYNDARGWR